MKHPSHSSPAPSHRSKAMFLLRATNPRAVTSHRKAARFRLAGTKASRATSLRRNLASFPSPVRRRQAPPNQPPGSRDSISKCPLMDRAASTT